MSEGVDQDGVAVVDSKFFLFIHNKTRKTLYRGSGADCRANKYIRDTPWRIRPDEVGFGAYVNKFVNSRGVGVARTYKIGGESTFDYKLVAAGFATYDSWTSGYSGCELFPAHYCEDSMENIMFFTRQEWHSEGPPACPYRAMSKKIRFDNVTRAMCVYVQLWSTE